MSIRIKVDASAATSSPGSITSAKFWLAVESLRNGEGTTIADVCMKIASEIGANAQQLTLLLDGFSLLPSQRAAAMLRDRDEVFVLLREAYDTRAQKSRTAVSVDLRKKRRIEVTPLSDLSTTSSTSAESPELPSSSSSESDSSQSSIQQDDDESSSSESTRSTSYQALQQAKMSDCKKSDIRHRIDNDESREPINSPNETIVKTVPLMAVPLSLGKNKRKLINAMAKRKEISMHVRFDENVPENHENGSESTRQPSQQQEPVTQSNGVINQVLEPEEQLQEPKVIQTFVELYDAQISSPKRRRGKRGPKKDSLELLDYGDDAYGRPVSTPSLPKNYSEFSIIDKIPFVGSKIAFKTLEMSANFTPEISEYKEATLLSANIASQTVTLQLLMKPKPKAALAPRKPVYYEKGFHGSEEGETVENEKTFEESDYVVADEFDSVGDGILTVGWKTLIEPRVVT
ncbi:hypothetical protein HDU83_006534 [Entophlyctis luteolus]|nr:hypothetical protein HDU83_006534 [Entophlyctis luteolus]